MDQVHVPLMPIMPTQRPCLRTLNQCLMQYRFSQGQRACFDGGFVLNIFLQQNATFLFTNVIFSISIFIGSENPEQERQYGGYLWITLQLRRLQKHMDLR